MFPQNVVPMKVSDAVSALEKGKVPHHSVSALGSSIGTAIRCSEGAAMSATGGLL